MLWLQQIPPWVVMWGVALGLYGVAKVATFVAGGLAGGPVGRAVGYLLFFPGMDAGAFRGPRGGARGSWEKGVRYVGNVAVGAGLLWGVARMVPGEYELVRGWMGMVGLVMVLHFGVLQLVSLGWQGAGFDVPLLMNEPVRAKSVSEFWSVRWNTAFRELAHRFLFKPLARRMGGRWGMLLTFLISGLVHELVISVPAGGGFGLPTGYFLLQGLGMQVERTGVGRRWLRGWRGRGFAVAVVAGPVGMLFHPLFVRRVFLPLMVAVGALPKEVCL